MLFTPHSLSNFIADRLDSRIRDRQIVTQLLLEFVTQKDQIELVKTERFKLSDEKILNLETYISKINSGTPIEHITKTRGFYGLDFFVNKDVLIPRPETELLVDLTKEKINSRLATNKQNELSILEIGTGSGCIPISIIKTSSLTNQNEVQFNFFSTDISKQALNIAEINVNNLLAQFESEKINNYSKFRYKNINFTILNMDIINPIGELEFDFIEQGIKFDLIISNPPYIPEKSMKELPNNVKKEPRNALVGGVSGFEIIEEILNQTKKLIKRDGEYLIEFSVETLEVAKEKIPTILPGYKYNVIEDLTQKPRIIHIFPTN